MRYSGKLGISQQKETSPGVWEETITEHDVLGDLVQRTEVLALADTVLPTYRTTTSISVLSRGVGDVDNSSIRYVTYAGKRWTIGSLVDQRPRLVIYIGEEYHGPIPDGAA
jgi:hypothetical protein